MKKLSLLLLAAGAMASAVFAGPYDTWGHYKTLTLNTSGLSLAADVANFPMLVRLSNSSTATGSDILSGSLSSGSDIAFADTLGNALSFERERFTNSAAEFWVRIPTVNGASASGVTKIRVYWGKASASDLSASTAVFDTNSTTGNGFQAVYHMNATGNVESNVTSNPGLNVIAQDTTTAGTPVSAAGAIGLGRKINSSKAAVLSPTGFGASNGVFFLDSANGWAVGNTGAIRKTVNGGLTWTSQTSGTSNNLLAVRFNSLTNGVAVGAGGTLLYTQNGGTSWTPGTVAGLSNTTSLNAIAFNLRSLNVVSTDSGFIAADSGKIISISALSTTPVFTLLTPTITGATTQNFRGIACDNTTCLVVGDSGATRKLYTINGTLAGAATGAVATTHNLKGVGYAGTGFRFTAVGDSAGVQGVIYTVTTTNTSASNTFTRYIIQAPFFAGGLVPPLTSVGYGVNNVSVNQNATLSTAGWIVGNGGTVIRTLNSGNNWGLVPNFTSANLTSVSIPMANVAKLASDFGWAVGGSTLVTAGGNYGQFFQGSITGGYGHADSLNFLENGPLAVSAWVNADYFDGAVHNITTKGDKYYVMQVDGAVSATVPNSRWNLAIYGTSTTISPGTQYVNWFAAAPGASGIAGTPTAATGWHLIVGTRKNPSVAASTLQSSTELYVDGALMSNNYSASSSSAQTRTINVLTIGKTIDGGGTGANDRFWTGGIDEFEYSNVYRDSTWNKLAYASQNPSASIITQSAAVTAGAGALGAFAYTDTLKTVDTLVINTGSATNLIPTYRGGPLDSVKVVGTTVTLPAGITVNKTTGAITGTATATFAAAVRTIRAWGHFAAGDSVTRSIRISAVQGPIVLTKYTQDTATYAVGVPVMNAPTFSSLGRAATGFSVSPALPAGLKIDTTNGSIWGTPTAAVAAANYTVKATNTTDTTAHIVRITTSGTAENFATWTKHHSVWFNTSLTSNGAKLSGTVTNFPVMIRLDATADTVFKQAKHGGADLRFSRTNASVMFPYQIERWDSAGKNAAIWVLVDTVYGNSLTQNIQMHWGNSAATSLSNGGTVFGTNNGFQAVWHLGSGSGDDTDATVNGIITTAMNAPLDSVGLIGHARNFDGASQYFQAANSASGPLNLHMTDSYTLSAWAKPHAITANASDGHKIIDKGDNQYVLAVYDDASPKWWEITTRGNNTYLQCTSNTQSTKTNNCTGPGTPIAADDGVGSWHHIVGEYQGAPTSGAIAETLYVDGALTSTQSLTNTNTTGRVETFNVSIGVQAAGTAPAGTTFTRYWNGLLDEVRISNKLRSSAWVALEYANQIAAQKLVVFNQPTGIASAQALVAGTSFSVKPNGNGLMFQVQGSSADKAVLSLVDMWGRKVWTGAFASGALAWDGRATNGQNVSAGIYVARVTLLDKDNKTLQTMDRKIPFTR